jgi:hypothetical protein
MRRDGDRGLIIDGVIVIAQPNDAGPQRHRSGLQGPQYQFHRPRLTRCQAEGRVYALQYRQLRGIAARAIHTFELDSLGNFNPDSRITVCGCQPDGFAADVSALLGHCSRRGLPRPALESHPRIHVGCMCSATFVRPSTASGVIQRLTCVEAAAWWQCGSELDFYTFFILLEQECSQA